MVALFLTCAVLCSDADNISDREDLYKKAMQAGFDKNGKGDAPVAQAEFGLALALAENASDAVRARNQIGFILKNQKRFHEARLLFRISLDTREADAGSKAEAQYLLAHSWIDEGIWDEAYNAWEKLAAMPGLWPCARSEARMIAGAGLIAKKKYKEARKLLSECITAGDGMDWHKWEAWLSIAKSYRAEYRNAEAKAAIQSLMEMKGVDEGRKKQASEFLESLK